MKIVRLLVIALFVAVLGASAARAQMQTAPCQQETDDTLPPGTICTNAQSIATGTFAATPFIDAVQTNGQWPDYGDPDHNIVSLYGTYGNNENNSTYSQAQAHYQQGITLAANIKPRCHDGSVPATTCSDGTVNPAIVFLFIGFSNFDIEIGGGSTDAWPPDPNHQALYGQPCSSVCPNLYNHGGGMPWNQVPGDPTIQKSLLYQVYPDSNRSHWLVGQHVVVWNGALEGQTLPEWDPSPDGYYNNHTCPYTGVSGGPECNYERVQKDLLNATGNGNTGGFTEAQVQAVFMKAADVFPQCDLNRLYCNPGFTLPDAYQMETYMGNIVRYLKCCENGTQQPRYPNLQQVFITSRIYGGFANGQLYGMTCENPEPFAYEGGFAVQRLIVDQINQVATFPGPVTYDYAGEVDYSTAPWIDWGPYLWASGTTARRDGLAWCNGVASGGCPSGEYDMREGDTTNQQTMQMYWGDFTHPTAQGQTKVADLLVNFMNGTTGSPWVTPWIRK